MLMLLSQNLIVRTIKLICTTFLKEALAEKVCLKSMWTLLVVSGKTFTRFVSNGWLSLETCCNKEFKMFEALKSMFISRGEKEGRLDIDDGSERKVYQM